ncbi:Oxygen-independent coproporphyrinogen III oxidase [Planktothrix tepida]|uniref:Coproporphyrinogen-III oxidase n=2 Tax=Planktothrix TaxID=54304 RepID=A0A1J1LM62_9CYAN|nr:MULTISPECIES: oxygen-independent coproporphyrinogen III oxidase [Planktothrix]CAD5952553.1 Oxygen-independent coproporphyrinogen III oxidase [Planktothrix tepida]CAD5958213.1 Oxygen-independent coproporphyrinogen III oxidase [Planktothrix pseudagardhii]CUR32697.1 coproporphyrinogen III oxidase, SAM and NAD(P)H dependent, oxygen-independent [Planktothrix tepida PCC 9214]
MVFSVANVAFDFDLIQKYDNAVPRYTSYPPATELKDGFTSLDWEFAITESNQRQSPLSLYFHIPFCQSACYFCGCNVIVSNNKDAARSYIDYLSREIDFTSQFIDTRRPVTQLHWGGGTPNYLSLEQVDSLWATINKQFTFADKAEISIEINPRYVDRNYIFFLKEMGFNRISFGIQDFNPEVQEAVNRVQPEALLFNVMDWIKEAGFESVNVDLIYGLPYQTVHTFKETIQKTLALDPDRIAIFNFAYVPWMKPVQKNIPQAALPQPHEKLEIWQMSIQELTDKGYVFIGMDHFAKPNDELAIAQQNSALKRNFQGYTTQPEAELYGFGLTSISMLEDTYAQNHKRLKEYYQAIDQGILPVSKGFKLSRDDVLRRDVIMQIMSNFYLDKSQIESKYHLDFDTYFAEELIEMRPLIADGLVQSNYDSIVVTNLGRLLVRNIAFLFDTHTPAQQQQRLSRAI